MRAIPLAFVVLAGCGPALPDARDPGRARSVAAAGRVEPSPGSATTAGGDVSTEPVTFSVVAACVLYPSENQGASRAGASDGIHRLADWDGPKTGTPVTTKKAWVFAPSAPSGDGLSLASVALRLVDIDKSDTSELVFSDRGMKYAVPPALASAAEPARGLVKGSVVRGSFGGNTMVALVESVDDASVTCVIRSHDKTSTEKVPLADVRLLDGKLAPGAPALVRLEEGGARHRGIVVSSSGDETWVTVDTAFPAGDPRAGRAVHKVKTAHVEVIDTTRPLKVGAHCLAPAAAEVQPCKVSQVIAGGVAYLVQFDADGSRQERARDEVAAAPRDTKK